MKLEIPFNEWSRGRLLTGYKIATTRNKKYGYIGDTFEVELGEPTGKKEYIMIAVFPHMLRKVAYDLFFIEGANSPSEFIDVWKEIHPRAGWTPEKMVWVHIFKQK